MRNVCSVFSLCTAAVATLVSVALVGIAFSTDNWLHITVDRTRLEPYAKSDELMREGMKTDTRWASVDIKLWFVETRTVRNQLKNDKLKTQEKKLDVLAKLIRKRNNLFLLLDFRYFDRVRGIFRICFPHGEKPQVRDYGAAPRSRSPRLYLNPIDEWCTNIDYYMQILGILPPLGHAFVFGIWI